MRPIDRFISAVRRGDGDEILFVRRAGRDESWSLPSLDNPGRPGKDWARLVGPVPLKTQSRDRIRRQDSPVPLAAFARRQSRENGTQATRSDEKPLPVE
jgi:hypothetical protein